MAVVPPGLRCMPQSRRAMNACQHNNPCLSLCLGEVPFMRYQNPKTFGNKTLPSQSEVYGEWNFHSAEKLISGASLD